MLRLSYSKSALFMVAMTLLAQGCGGSSAPSAQPNPPPPAATPDTQQQFISAVGWTEIHLLATDSANITISVSGHFDSSRNSCGYPVEGVFDVGMWNQIVQAFNASVVGAPLKDSEVVCTDSVDSWPRMNGNVEVVLDDQAKTKRTLYKSDGDWKVCSYIRDRAISDQLLTLLNQVVQTSDKEDCPNGWGS